MKQHITVNRKMGKQPPIGFIPVDVWASWAIIILAILLLAYLFSLPFATNLQLTTVLILGWWFLTGHKQGRYIARMFSRLNRQKWSRTALHYVPLEQSQQQFSHAPHSSHPSPASVKRR